MAVPSQHIKHFFFNISVSMTWVASGYLLFERNSILLFMSFVILATMLTIFRDINLIKMYKDK